MPLSYSQKEAIGENQKSTSGVSGEPPQAGEEGTKASAEGPPTSGNA